MATIEIDSPYAPIPADTRAMLRQKTLLGETYVELTQGDATGRSCRRAGPCPGRRSSRRCSSTRSSGPSTRRRGRPSRPGCSSSPIASAGRGRGPERRDREPRRPSPRTPTRCCACSTRQQGAVQQFVRDTGEVFGALSERQGQLQGLIRNSGIVFHTTAVAEPGPRGHVPGAADLPRRVEADPEPPRQLLPQRQPADHPAPSFRQAAERQPEAGREGGAELQQLLHRPQEGREALGQTGLPALQKLLDTDLPPLLTEITPVLAGRSPRSSPGHRPLPERRHRVPRQRRLVAERDGDDRDRGEHPLHPQLRAAVPGLPRHLHLAPARLLAGEPVSGPQQRPQGRQRARHLRHDGVLGRGRAGRAASIRSTASTPGTRSSATARPSTLPRRSSTRSRSSPSPGQNPSTTAGAFPSPACTKSPAAAVDRPGLRAERLHARLRESLSRFGRISRVATDYSGSGDFMRNIRTTKPISLC